MIIYSDWVYKKASPLLSVLNNKSRDKKIETKSYKYILLGYNRIGFSIIKSFDKITDDYLVVDYDPKVIETLQSNDINCIYGDVEDLDILESLNISKSKVVVSTIPELGVGKLILRSAKKTRSCPVVILTERQIEDALELYADGADYVILPHFLGGEYTAKLIERATDDKSIYEIERKKDILLLEERKKHGHEHPKVERERIKK
jgi:Trk K+ transport system NAD-binding subunit